MIEKHDAEDLRATLERVARDLGPDERLWLEVHSLRHRRQGRRWKAAICRQEDVPKLIVGKSSEGVALDLDYPSQLADWLKALGVQPMQPMPDDWNDIMFFGCAVRIDDQSPAIHRGAPSGGAVDVQPGPATSRNSQSDR